MYMRMVSLFNTDYLFLGKKSRNDFFLHTFVQLILNWLKLSSCTKHLWQKQHFQGHTVLRTFLVYTILLNHFAIVCVDTSVISARHLSWVQGSTVMSVRTSTCVWAVISKELYHQGMYKSVPSTIYNELMEISLSPAPYTMNSWKLVCLQHHIQWTHGN